MNKHDEDLGEPTYSEVRRKFRDWHDNRPPPPRRRRRYVPSAPALSPAVARPLFTALGAGIGLLLLLLAAISFYAASTWGAIARDGAAVGYAVIGFFLAVAGFSAIVASWNHNYRVATRTASLH